ncbi:alkylmercury lyase family protein [Streptomyces sp. ISL-98]|uniref:alkylmercury lyase family protein n=1 Tax=Streptomyces sp. ISL-98 TaxID=2819192 RepID=UPI001BE61662|nr:alkylmercury lyase family protein [Streptomyces sp. ISL-98]MBT2511277.1 alkylmercury lyase family protein [Streptomyces sp. ISL-98]
MHITVLTVPDCPNAPLAHERITAALDGRSAQVELIEVSNEARAAERGMTGSPTVLIDGIDPFAAPGGATSVSCRLYRGPDGRTDGAPSVADLHRALDLAEVTRDCECPPMDAAGRAGRGRLAPREGGLRAVQQAVLRHFARTGRAPEAADLEEAASAHGRRAAEVLNELAAEDFLALDSGGQIRAAYPFSGVPTAHRVRFPDGVQAWSMCAIDALGVSAMLDTDAVITSSDPVTGEAITVVSANGNMTWEPATAVVYVGQGSCTGSAAEVACGALNFFTSRATARTWSTQHPDFSGGVVEQTRAEALGQAVFATLLTESDHA